MRLKDFVTQEKKRLANLPKVLYCIAFQVWNKKMQTWIPKEEYLHAYDAYDAKLNWAAGVPRHYKVGFNINLVGVAPVVGVHAEETADGKKEVFSV
jgi:hypothetical protein